MIASFSRALTEGLHVDQSDAEYSKMIGDTIASICAASAT
jgi:fructose-bisphosphate aldolase class I